MASPIMMNLSNFIKEFPPEKPEIKYQLSFMLQEVSELRQALLSRDWDNAKMEGQQIVQCIGYLLVTAKFPAQAVNLLTPFQSDYMRLALERAKSWDKAREYVENKGFQWRLPGRCSRSLRHFSSIMSRLYPELTELNWESILES